jgi:hypothetical protein
MKQLTTYVQRIKQRLSSLVYLTRPLLLTFVGIVLLSVGVAYLLIWLYQTVPVPGVFYYLTLQFLPQLVRGLLLLIVGTTILVVGIWKLSGTVVIPLHGQAGSADEVVVDYRARRLPRITVLSGGAGMLVLSSLSRHADQLICITPLQDSIEYYYRASSLFQAQNVDYVVPTPYTPKVYAELNDGTTINVMHVDHHGSLAGQYVTNLYVSQNQNSLTEGNGQNSSADALRHTAELKLTRPAADAIRNADALVLGPGSLFESVLPNFLMDEFRSAVQQSSAKKIFICNLMTEPGLTTGFGVSEHIRQIKRYCGFTPDYVLVNVQRIEAEVQQLYEAAHQLPVYVTPEEYEETVVPKTEGVTERQLIIEGSVVIETDLASSVVQYKASISNPGESRAVRVLRHDPEKLTTALLEILRRL